MNQLSLHQASAHQLAALSQKLPPAMLLAGPAGVGLLTIAKGLTKPLAKQVLVITPDEKDTIGIEIIRELYTNTRAKQTEKQIIIIDNAEAMSLPAQNAFLKLLEEPTVHTSFLLTSHASDQLLSTIRSRTQLVNIQLITPAQTNQYLDKLKIADSRQRQQLIFIAEGLPAELFRLAQDEVYFKSQAELARTARDFLSSTMYKKLLLVHQFGNNREQALELLSHIARILKYSLQANPKRNLALQLDKSLKASQNLSNNGHVRTQLLGLALGL